MSTLLPIGLQSESPDLAYLIEDYVTDKISTASYLGLSVVEESTSNLCLLQSLVICSPTNWDLLVRLYNPEPAGSNGTYRYPKLAMIEALKG